MTTAFPPETDDKVSIFRRIRGHLTQEQAGRRIGKSQDYWSRLERGLKSPTVRELRRIAVAFKKNPKALVKHVLGAEAE